MVKAICDYTSCKIKTKLMECSHCKRHFCSEHADPIEPGSYHPEKSRLFVNRTRLNYEKTHPCPDYVDYLEEQNKIRSIKYGKVLDKLSGRIPKYKARLNKEKELVEERDEEKYELKEEFFENFEEKEEHNPNGQTTSEDGGIVIPEEGTYQPAEIGEIYDKENVRDDGVIYVLWTIVLLLSVGILYLIFSY